MDQETVKYIVQYYANLYTLKEKYEIEIAVVKSVLGAPEAVANYISQRKLGMFTEDEEYLELVGMDASEFNSIVATKLLQDHRDKIFLNYCAKCYKLARTPWAKQCRHCDFDWH